MKIWPFMILGQNSPKKNCQRQNLKITMMSLQKSKKQLIKTVPMAAAAIQAAPPFLAQQSHQQAVLDLTEPV